MPQDRPILTYLQYLPTYPTYPTLVVKARKAVSTYTCTCEISRRAVCTCIHVPTYLPICNHQLCTQHQLLYSKVPKYLVSISVTHTHTHTHIPPLPSPPQAKEKKACYYCYCYCFFLLLFQVRESGHFTNVYLVPTYA